MIYKNAEAGEKPAKVVLENLPEKTIVRLTDNVTTFQTGEEIPQEMFRFDEVVFDLPDDRADETAESIEANFSDWWEFGQADPEDETVSLEDRIAALEEMYMLGMEG